MADESPKTDAVDKLLSEEQSLEQRKQALIADLLQQKEAASREFDEKKTLALKAFNEKLAKLGYKDSSPGKPRRSHHKTPAAPVNAAKPKNKT